MEKTNHSFKSFLPTRKKLLDSIYRRHFIVFCLSCFAFIACMVFGLINVFSSTERAFIYGLVEIGFSLVSLLVAILGGFFYKTIKAVEVIFYCVVLLLLNYILFSGGAFPSSSTYWVLLLPLCVYMFCTFKNATILNAIMFTEVFVVFYTPAIRNSLSWLSKIAENDINFCIRFPLIYMGCSGLGILFSLLTTVVNKENERLMKKFSHSSETDFLTQLHNRYWLAHFIEKEKANLVDGDITNVLYIDIDDFKRFNDNFGHGFGDEVLMVLSNILTQYCKENVVRLGGDEFLYVTKNKTPGELRNLSEKIRIAADEYIFEENKHAHFTVSIGVASINALKDMNYEQVIFLADRQSAKAKKEGKNRVFQIISGQDEE